MSELKAINAHGVRKDDGSYYDRSQVDKYIDELDERHTTEITALEVSYKLQLDGLRYDKDAEIRRLKRALWLARAEIAHKKIDEYWPDYCHNAHSRIALLKWEEVERKCRKKSKEYL